MKTKILLQREFLSGMKFQKRDTLLPKLMSGGVRVNVSP